MSVPDATPQKNVIKHGPYFRDARDENLPRSFTVYPILGEFIAKYCIKFRK